MSASCSKRTSRARRSSRNPPGSPTDYLCQIVEALWDGFKAGRAAPVRQTGIKLTGDDAEDVQEIWQTALMEAAFYVEGHCADGSRHAATIADMAMPKITSRAAPVQAVTIPEAPDTSQDWARLDGGTAFHLIERHADDWADARNMMESWGRAHFAALLQPVEPEGERDGWISVYERRPEVGQQVLVFTPKRKFGDSIFLDTWDEQRECPVEFSTVSVPTGEGWNEHYFEEVSHWRPLPAAPIAAIEAERAEAPKHERRRFERD